MCKTINCPTCQSTNVRSIDNQPLAHPSKMEVETKGAPRIDTELYMSLKCDNCNKIFEKVFDLVLQK